ncbi:hypothetical protein ACFSJY_05005 [Thalassotalea euphylliae]|uniref:hypothetical protein n=1 Tax=Thalassotalea euphylliae TaxID=1655234 RepID=UPI0036453887
MFKKLAMTLCSLCLIPGAFATEKPEQFYGNVINVKVIAPETNVPEGTLLGGMLGLLIGDSTQSVLSGAAGGFAITSALEGDRRIFIYKIEQGTQLKQVALDNGKFNVGDCVVIETIERHVNVRPVSNSFCLHPSHPALSEQDVTDMQTQQANACVAARKALLAATTDKETDNALIKVRALCEQ